MSVIYQFLILLSQGLLPLGALFNPKLKQFHSGRKEVFKQLKKSLDPARKTIWVHAASLGEYEQGVPVLEALRRDYPNDQILLSFFSPSGFEIRKNTDLATVVCYLPIDSFKNARRFVQQVKPRLALFVKYEVWPNYMLALEEARVPTVLFSGIFRPSQIYFKWYAGFMRESLRRFSKIFVQDQNSIDLLASIGIADTALTGDTRFDRVHSLSLQPKPLPKTVAAIVAAFVDQTPCLVGGSIWPEDLAVLAPALAQYPNPLKIILAPHKVDSNHIALLLETLPRELREKTCLLSQAKTEQVTAAQILMVDQIGILNSLYPLAQLAYVGGGFKTGLHNTLEAAVYGIPLAIGPLYESFKEARELANLGGICVLKNRTDATDFLSKATETNYQKQVQELQQLYIAQQLGSTKKIMTSVAQLLSE